MRSQILVGESPIDEVGLFDPVARSISRLCLASPLDAAQGTFGLAATLQVEPPPTARPDGWYPDRSGLELNRYPCSARQAHAKLRPRIGGSMMQPGPEECPIGEAPLPPYFFGASEKFEQAFPDPFASKGWMSHCEAYAAVLKGNRRKWLSLRGLAKALVFGHPDMTRHLRPLLSLIRDTMERKSTVSVLDIGGGFGDNYHAIYEVLRGKQGKLEYHVVDSEPSCDLGRRLYPSGAPGFSTEIPERTFDIVAIIGTLQYILEWRSFVEIVKRHADEAVYLARSPIRRNGRSFFARQAVCPAFGEQALKKVGTCNIVVIGKGELESMFGGWLLTRDELQEDYSAHFSRLPIAYQDVAYFNMVWERSR